MSKSEFEIPEALIAIIEYAEAKHVNAIGEFSGCWESQVDEQWWIAVNGHGTWMECGDGRGAVPPYATYIEYNGFPAGIVDASGGEIVAAKNVNEFTFLKATRDATAKVSQKNRARSYLRARYGIIGIRPTEEELDEMIASETEGVSREL